MAVCNPGPTLTIDKINIPEPANSIENAAVILDTTDPEAPGASMYADEPETSVNLSGDDKASWPVPDPAPGTAEKTFGAQLKAPSIPGESADPLVFPDGIKYSMKLSKHLTLGQLGPQCLFKHHIRPIHGLTNEQVATNLKTLAINVLDPVIDQFGTPGGPGYVINNGFRYKPSSISQHTYGRAADLQWVGQTASFHLTVVQWMRTNLKFDQLFIEKGNSYWIHVSYNADGLRQLVGTNLVASSRRTWEWGVLHV